MFTFTRVLLFSSCWWRGCRDAHRFTSQLMKTTSCDATEYCRETTQNTRLTLLFSYLRFLFLNVYRANLSLSLGESDWDCVVVSWQSDRHKDNNKNRNSEAFWRPRTFLFFLCMFGWERLTVDWGERHAEHTEKQRERESGCSRASNTFQTLCERTRCFLLEGFVRAVWSEVKTRTDSFPPAWSEQWTKQTHPRPRYRSTLI